MNPVPYRNPQGEIVDYACGKCGHHGGISGGDRKSLIKMLLENAERCCTTHKCTGCDVQVEYWKAECWDCYTKRFPPAPIEACKYCGETYDCECTTVLTDKIDELEAALAAAITLLGRIERENYLVGYTIDEEVSNFLQLAGRKDGKNGN